MIGGPAMLGSYFAASENLTAAFIFLVVAGACMYAPYGPYFAIIPERVTRNVTGFVGSHLVAWLQSTTGGPKEGFLLMSTAVVPSSCRYSSFLGRSKHLHRRRS